MTTPILAQRLRRALTSVCEQLSALVTTVADAVVAPTAATFVPAVVPATVMAVGAGAGNAGTDPNPGSVSMAYWSTTGTKRHLPGALAGGLT
jgi:hypothetical protein